MDTTLHGQASATGSTAGSPLLIAAVAGMIVLILGLTLAARLTGYDASAVPPSPIVDSRMLGFRDLSGGIVEVFDWQNGEVLRSIPAGEGSFLRGVVRSLVRQRRGMALDATTPFSLQRYADGRLVLADEDTGESIDLIAFGSTNVQAFARLLSPAAAGLNPGAP